MDKTQTYVTPDPSAVPTFPASAATSAVPASSLLPDILNSAHGPLPIPMTNDCLFRILMERSRKTLHGLLSALLHLEPAAIIDTEIRNPYEFGVSVKDKKYILDVKLMLNRHTIINLEMQVVNASNWPERSLCYLARSFGELNQGDDYAAAKPAVQIGILNYTLFQEHPEFLANYYMINIKNHHIYSDKFRLTVLDLTQKHLATPEDISYKTDVWASLFKAATWEDIKMLVRQNPELQDTATAICQLTMEEKIRMECESREEFLRREATTVKLKAIAEAERDQAVARLNQAVTERDQAIAERDQTATKLNQALQLLKLHGIDVNE